tara:strand:+ start:101 stop:502 length:402 start_codon:yes stop_codon:yes gene_type:complete
MAVSEQPVSFEQRASNQIYLMSQLIEQLTLKVLDLEEKINHLKNKQSITIDNQQVTTQAILKDNEQKLIEINGLLDMETTKAINSNQQIEEISQDKKTNDNHIENNSNQSENINNSFIDTEYIDNSQEDLLSA